MTIDVYLIDKPIDVALQDGPLEVMIDRDGPIEVVFGNEGPTGIGEQGPVGPPVDTSNITIDGGFF